ncbi:MAG: acyl-CoA dehydrogenase family protein, partial [Candidatus Geothermarchaeales archaeon]
AGLDAVTSALVMEEIARASGSVALSLAAHNSLALGHLYTFGSEHLRQRYVKRLSRGERIGAWALTEPEAGSDAKSIQTTARKSGDEWLLNGEKFLITNGSVADFLVVMARTKPGRGETGISAFLVEKEFQGFDVVKDREKLGLHASPTSDLLFRDCRVPAENLVGEVNNGYSDAMSILDGGRIGMAAFSVGIAQASLDAAISYSKDRHQFGRPIAEFQAIRFMIADVATRLEASRLLYLEAAQRKDRRLPFTKEASMAKLFASETAMKAAWTSVQIHGGYGYVTAYPVERYFRDAKLCEIGEGTSEIQRLVISREILKGL